MKKLQKKFFSVIIPAYNSERTILKAITSVIKQNIDCEIIIIDDLSKDKTLKIVTKVKKKYENIKILRNKSNIGVSRTRNLGIKKAQGEYIIFLDSDDFLFDKCLIKLKKYIISNKKPDVIFGKFEKETFPRNNELILKKLQLHKNNILKFKKLIVSKKFPLDECWPYILNRKFLTNKKINFFDVRVAEDQLFVLNVFLKMRSFYIFKTKFYYHRNLPGTLSDFMNFEYSKCCLKVLLEYYKILANEKNLTNRELINKYIQSCFSMFISIFITSTFSEIKELGQILKKNNAKVLKNLNYNNSKINFSFLFQKYGYEKGLLRAKKIIINLKRKKIEEFIHDKKKIYFFCYSKFLNASAKIMGKNWKKVIGILDQNKLLYDKSFKNKRILEPNKILKNKKNTDISIIINNHREITSRKIKNYLLGKKILKKNLLVLNY